MGARFFLCAAVRWALKPVKHTQTVIFLALISLAFQLRATPANKSALQRHFGLFLGKDLDRCTTCHLPSSNKAPESLDEFPHNPFGDRLRVVGRKLAREGKSREISGRLKLVAKEDADGDGASNESELLLGHNPGDDKDVPTKTELDALKSREVEFRKFLASYQWRPFDLVRAPEVPRVKHRGWVRNSIDAYVAAQHDAYGLKPRPEASKDILLRRVYLDLIGLAPTPEEIAAFEADRSKQAYEKVVERLLRDKRYGERWGRHWLDIWRYSDWAGWSGGNQIRDSKPHIWRWRDWTVEALNDDKPYDQMILEMLAADELRPSDTNALRATGFLVRNYKMLSREQWLEDTVKHTSQAFLGVTMGCAKCHNHMYDPISQKEYYQFRAIFEPHQVRTDRVPGQIDTAKDGLVRVFDVGTNTPTYFFVRGDERKADTNRLMQPGVPRSLHGTFDLEPVILPEIAAQPDKRPFVIEDLKRESETAAKTAQTQLTEAQSNPDSSPEKLKELELAAQIAELKHASLLATLKVEQLEDNRRKKSEEWTESAKAARHKQDELAVVEARLKLFKAQAEEKGAQAKLDKAEEDESAKKKLESAKKEVADASAKLAEAEKTAAAEATTDYKPRPAEIFPDVSTGRRLALAKWITSRENPLTARVAMNHIWLRHFGQGIVPTPADFGFNGKPPTDPALLDWLAAEFMKRDWNMKEMHRLIVTSATYRMASTPDPANAKIDPDNQFLWRMPSRRMEGEIVRDNLLYVAGDLDPTMGGPDIDHMQGLTSKRRSIYLRIAAEKEVEFLKIFDGPSVTECYMRRPSVVPQQALALANSELAFREARSLAQAISCDRDDEFIGAAYRRVLSRDPKPEEMKVCADFLAGEQRKNSVSRARQNLILVLFNHNDFVTIR